MRQPKNPSDARHCVDPIFRFWQLLLRLGLGNSLRGDLLLLLCAEPLLLGLALLVLLLPLQVVLGAEVLVRGDDLADAEQIGVLGVEVLPVDIEVHLQ